MPFVAPKVNTTTNNNASGNNANSPRPPWVKEDGSISLRSTSKPTVPWAQNTNEDEKTGKAKGRAISSWAAKSSTDKEPTNSFIVVRNTEPPTVKKVSQKEPVKKIMEPVKRGLNTPLNRVLAGVKKKASSSSEEEEETDDETEEETSSEETSEEEKAAVVTSKTSTHELEKGPVKGNVATTNKTIVPPKKSANSIPTPQTGKESTASTVHQNVTPSTVKTSKNESELTKRFSIEKPKLRPVNKKRDKSNKKIVENDDPEAVEGETEEERERRLRFKLDKPKLRHVKRDENPISNKSSENILKLRPTLKKVTRNNDIQASQKDETKPEFKTKTLRKTPSLKREPSLKNGELFWIPRQIAKDTHFSIFLSLSLSLLLLFCTQSKDFDEVILYYSLFK